MWALAPRGFSSASGPTHPAGLVTWGFESGGRILNALYGSSDQGCSSRRCGSFTIVKLGRGHRASHGYSCCGGHVRYISCDGCAGLRGTDSHNHRELWRYFGGGQLDLDAPRLEVVSLGQARIHSKSGWPFAIRSHSLANPRDDDFTAMWISCLVTTRTGLRPSRSTSPQIERAVRSRCQMVDSQVILRLGTHADPWATPRTFGRGISCARTGYAPVARAANSKISRLHRYLK